MHFSISTQSLYIFRLNTQSFRRNFMPDHILIAGQEHAIVPRGTILIVIAVLNQAFFLYVLCR